MSKPWRTGLLGIALLVALAAVAGAQSQATTGVIEGTVVDAEGAVLPGATVTLRNTATNYEKVVTTDGEGRFRAPLLPLGPYRVTVAIEGFATLVREGLDLAVGQTITLQLSTFQQEIVVTGEAPVVETTRTEGATRIDEASVEGLPNNGRNFLDFTELTPGVTTGCPGVREAAVVGRPDPEWGEVPVAYVVADGPLDEPALLAHCKRELAGFKVPRAFRPVEALPRNPLGKVEKHRLP